MKKKFYLIIGVLFLAGIVNAQEKSDTTYWKSGGTITITFSQISLSNWAAGGQNSISTNGLLSLFANYKKQNVTFDNSLDMCYGMTQQGSSALIKSDDRIDLSSKLGRYAFKYWYYSALINLKSQMTAGYNYPNDSDKISNFFAPAYLVYAVGMDFKPNDHFALFLSPLAGKTTIVHDQNLADAGSFGVDKAETDAQGNITKKGKRSLNQFGGYIKMAYIQEVIKNVTVNTKLDLFSNYLKNPQNIVVNWDLLITMKINKLLTVNINTTMIYDDNVMILIDEKTGDKGPRLQFKEVFGVGLSYKF